MKFNQNDTKDINLSQVNTGYIAFKVYALRCRSRLCSVAPYTGLAIRNTCTRNKKK